ncbi:MAG: PAS domain-containing protein, partial [Chloroflexi bacterium]|nr:PAS domain-containing protein [Chloroflexota bacterium]
MYSKDRATSPEGDENGGRQAAAAARLQAEKAEILARWQLKVRTALAAAGPSETPLLSNRIPSILETLEGQLAQELSQASAPAQTDSLIPGSEGPLPRVILEYRLLREAIFDVVERGGPVQTHEREAILTVLERAIQDAVTEAARLERKGQHWTEEQYRLLVDNARDFAIFMLDVDGHIVSWNPGAEQITRYRVEEIIGEHVSILYTEADVSAGEPAKDLLTAREQGKVEVDRWYCTS